MTAPTGCAVPGPQKRPMHMEQWRPDGADQLRAQVADATGAHGRGIDRGTGCSGGPLAPTSCVRMLRKRPGRRVQWRPDSADRLRAQVADATGAHGRGIDRGTGCSGGPLAPTSCVRMLRKRPGRRVQWRPDSADRLRAQVADATGAHGRGIDRGTGCSGGPLAPTSCVRMLRKRPGRRVQWRPDSADRLRAQVADATGAHGRGIDRGTGCSGGPLAPTSCVRMLRKRPGRRVQWRPDSADRLRAQVADATGAHGRGIDRGTGCSGGPLAPTSCVRMLRKRPGRRVQWRPDSADRLRAQVADATGAHVPGPQKRPMHMEQWRPDGADQLRAQVADATGA
eukprot:jgi/Tetstr1/431093/TSEL_020809.t1